MELGAVIAKGPPAEVLAHPRVIASYLGTNEAAIHRSGARGGPPDVSDSLTCRPRRVQPLRVGAAPAKR